MEELINKKFDIYDFMTNRIIHSFEKSLKFDELEREKLYLGILALLNNTIKTLFICSASLFLGCLKETLFMILILFSLRITAAGLHAKNNFMCTFTSLLAYICCSSLSIHLPINKETSFIICIVLTILLYKYSPADTANKPILGLETRKKLKNQTLITAIIFLILNLIFLNTTLINSTMYAMLCQVISILPVTYKLLKRSYNNYERYEN